MLNILVGNTKINLNKHYNSYAILFMTKRFSPYRQNKIYQEKRMIPLRGSSEKCRTTQKDGTIKEPSPNRQLFRSVSFNDLLLIVRTAVLAYSVRNHE